MEQFLNANVNTRTDARGGSAQKRNRFTLDVARATAAGVGAERVGIRLSPYGVFNATGAFEGVEEQYSALARELGSLKRWRTCTSSTIRRWVHPPCRPTSRPA